MPDALRYSKGDCLTLAYPNNRALLGEEIEILSISSIIDKIYEIRILSTGERFLAKENQLAPLDNKDTVTRWEDGPWQPNKLI
jgi:sulfite reductase alpha subunit-like flavoprotein